MCPCSVSCGPAEGPRDEYGLGFIPTADTPYDRAGWFTAASAVFAHGRPHVVVLYGLCPPHHGGTSAHLGI